MGKYWGRGFVAAALALGAHGAWAQSVTGCPTGQVMQSSDPSGKNITCVAVPDPAALQQQFASEASARQQADNALGARIDALEGVGPIIPADIVGTWTVSGTTNCLQSSTGFSEQFMSPIVSGPGGPQAIVSQLGGTFIGTRTFYADGTGRSIGVTHALSFPATLHGPQVVGAPLPTGVSSNTGGASVAPLDAGFTWDIQPDGSLLIDDDGTIPQSFTAPPSLVGTTVKIENLPPFVGLISKDRRTIVMTHPGMSVETSVTVNPAGEVVRRTPRFCTRHRVLTRLN